MELARLLDGAHAERTINFGGYGFARRLTCCGVPQKRARGKSLGWSSNLSLFIAGVGGIFLYYSHRTPGEEKGRFLFSALN